MEYSPFFGMNILVAKHILPYLPLIYLCIVIFTLLFAWLVHTFLSLVGGKDA